MARRDEAVQVEGENGAHVLRRRGPVPSAPVRTSSTSSTRMNMKTDTGARLSAIMPWNTPSGAFGHERC